MTHTVRILPAERRITVRPGESVLAAALREGFAFPYSCRNGSCGACIGTVLEGRIAYPNGRPLVLTAREEDAGKAIFCQAQPLDDLLIEAREITETRSQQVRALPARVERMEDLAGDVKRLWLRLPPNETLDFLAGQYIDVLLRDGRRRSFSLANRPSAGGLLELHVRLAPGGRFTGYVFDGLRARDLLRIEGPLGTFFMRDTATPALLVAGGTGFAPIKAMVEQHLAAGGRRELHLFWGARTPADLYLDGLARQWHDDGVLQYTPVLSHVGDDAGWHGECGWVHDALLRRHPALAGHEVYMSGPPAMINAARPGLTAAGMDDADLFFDAFDYAEDSMPETRAPG